MVLVVSVLGFCVGFGWFGLFIYSFNLQKMAKSSTVAPVVTSHEQSAVSDFSTTSVQLLSLLLSMEIIALEDKSFPFLKA